MLFQKNLQDLIKISKSAGDLQAYLNSCVAEIKNELKSKDVKTKTNAILKLYFVKHLCIVFSFVLALIIFLKFRQILA